MDARHPLTELDRRMIEWFLPTGRSLHILMTKSDKLSHTDQRRSLETVRRALTEDYDIFSAQASVQLFSASPRSGIAEAEGAIAPWLRQPLGHGAPLLG